MKYLILIVFFVLSMALKASDSIELPDEDTQTVSVISGGNSYTVYLDESDDDAKSESSPLVLYLPTTNTSVVNHNSYFYQSRAGKTVLNFSTANRSSMAISFPLVLDVSGNAKYVTSAVKVGGVYKVVGQSTTTYPSGDHSILFPLSPQEFCSTFPLVGSTNPCSETSANSITMTSYFFLSETLMAQGSDVSADDYPDGVYFSLKFSNVVSSTIPVITKSRIGDKQLTLEFSSNTAFANPRFVRVYDHVSAPVLVNSPIGSYTSGGLTSTEYKYEQNGSVVVKNLTNGTEYILSVLFVDLYGFGSVLSDKISARPLLIEELLKKEGCFLLTAGFGGEHFVIDYFRNFRDSVLVKSSIGRQFVSTYYELAPKYALSIYNNEVVRAGIRGLAYCLYFVFNYFALVSVIALFCVVIFCLIKNQEKIKT